MKKTTSNSQLELVLMLIDAGYDKTSWHGPNLRGSIRRMTAEQAAWRPAPQRHNAWEIVLHAAYWKYVARRRLLGEKRGSFPLRGSNWFARPVELTEEAWRGDVGLLDEVHRSLREAVTALPPKQLHVIPAGSKVSNFQLLSGIASHDVYHAGQIQLLKRLQNTWEE